MRRSLALLTALAAFATALPSYSQQLQKFPTITLNAGLYLIKAEVASTEAQREQGLMFRDKMGANEGMVFAFGQPAGVCMWMKNTLIPLSVAFMDETGKIINIEEMKEQTLEKVSKPSRPAQWMADLIDHLRRNSPITTQSQHDSLGYSPRAVNTIAANAKTRQIAWAG